MAAKHPKIGKGPFKPHPFSEFLPRHSDAEITEIRDSIRVNGQRFPIVLLWHEGEYKVLDGNGRQKAVLAVPTVKPWYRLWGTDQGDGANPLDWVADVNLKSRHLTPAQRALAARDYANLKKGQRLDHAKAQDPTKVGSSPRSQKEAAAKFGVNVKQIERANKVKEKGVPELRDAMEKEKVSISDAAAIADQPPKVQRQAVSAVLDGKQKTLTAAVKEIAPKPKPAEDPGVIADDLDAITERVRVRPVPQSHIKARETICELLLKVSGAIRKLPKVTA